MKYDKDTMNSLQEAYKSISEGDDHEGKKLGDVEKEKYKEKLKKASQKAPTPKNKIVGFNKESYERRIKEAYEMSRKEYTSEEKTVKHKMTKDEFNRIPKDFRGGTKEKPRATVGITDEMGNTTPVSREVEIIKKKVVPEGVDKKKEMDDKMKEVEDMRSLPTRMNLIKTKLRAMGLNMSHVLKGKELSEVIDYTLNELNRYEKETGKSSGSVNMPKGTPTQKGGDTNPVMRTVRTSSRKGRPEGQQKKKKAVKTTAGTNKFLNMQNDKREYAAKAKKAGFKSVQDFTNTMAIYGGEDNYKAGRGSGS